MHVGYFSKIENITNLILHYLNNSCEEVIISVIAYYNLLFIEGHVQYYCCLY